MTVKLLNYIYHNILVILGVIALLFSNTYNLHIDFENAKSVSSCMSGQESLSVSDNVFEEILCNDEVINNISHILLFQNNTKVQRDTYRYGTWLSSCMLAFTAFLIYVKVCLSGDVSVFRIRYFIIRYIHSKDGKKKNPLY